MAKVSIGLRGWRFEESEVFTADGEFRPLEEIPEDERHRLVRLMILIDKPCDACYLIHGEEEKRRCNPATIVYGEPLNEVLLCDDHEADFLHWYREEGGKAHRGEEEFRDAFHEWFAAGGRAPEGYGGLDHVETDPEELPSPPDPKEVQQQLETEAEFERRKIDLRSVGEDDGDDDESDAEDEFDDFDLNADYPKK